MKAVLAIVTVIIISNMVVGDPRQTGGASCSTFKDCGGIDKGYCDGNTINGTFNGSCICGSKYGNPDCTYNRFSKDLTGGLQFLCFAGVGGVGNFVLGRNSEAIAQLLLMSGGIFVAIAVCILNCPFAVLFGSSDIYKIIAGLVNCAVGILLGLASFAGFIWSIVDGALILQGKITDPNGYSLY